MTVAAPERAGRTTAVDLLRGAVMVLMVLDHARDFFVDSGRGPTDLATTTVPLFLTRWVTHFCAPVFVLLAGVAAQLRAQQKGLPSTRRFLVTRGLWLVLLELTVVRFAWIPDPFYRFTFLQVIWVLGWSMIVLAVLSYASRGMVLAFGLLVVLGHNALDGWDRANLGSLEPLWNVLHERALFSFGGRQLYISYPLLPWFGVISLGFALGAWYQEPAAERQRLLLRTGALISFGFVLLRLLNVYGDPEPWSAQPRGSVFTLLSFLNCQKYPPSLAYLAMTLGPALLALALLERSSAAALPRLLALGRVPLFFYVAHLYLLRIVGGALAYARYGAAAFAPPPGHAGSPELGLWAAYAASAGALVVLVPACSWFARKKAQSRAWWLSYL